MTADRHPQAFVAGWPQIYHGLSGPKPAQAERWRRVAACIGRVFNGQGNRATRVGGVVLVGATGAGKTALAALGAKLCDQKLHIEPALIRCADLKFNLRGLPSDRRMDTLDYLDLAGPQASPYLQLDDVGVEKGNPEAEELVRAIVDLRTQGYCFTAITSNLDWPGLVDHLGGDRNESRLAALEYIDFAGLPDYRREQPNA